VKQGDVERTVESISEIDDESNAFQGKKKEPKTRDLFLFLFLAFPPSPPA